MRYLYLAILLAGCATLRSGEQDRRLDDEILVHETAYGANYTSVPGNITKSLFGTAIDLKSFTTVTLGSAWKFSGSGNDLIITDMTGTPTLYYTFSHLTGRINSIYGFSQGASEAGGTWTGAGVLTVPQVIGSTGAGANGLAVSTNGARVDFGAGASDYATSDGTTVTFAGPIAITGSTAKGTITLSAGSGTATVTSGSTCICVDTTAVAAVKCSLAATTLTATGTGTDVIAYHCL